MDNVIKFRRKTRQARIDSTAFRPSLTLYDEKNAMPVEGECIPITRPSVFCTVLAWTFVFGFYGFVILTIAGSFQ